MNMETNGKESPSYSTVKKGAVEFRKEEGWERERIENNERSGRPKEATTDENFEIMNSLVMCDRRRNPRDIASKVCFSSGEIQSVLTG